MPGPISDTTSGPSDQTPYVPSWCFENGPKMCKCGHHEGYHSDAGECLHAKSCGCAGADWQYAAKEDEK